MIGLCSRRVRQELVGRDKFKWSDFAERELAFFSI